MRGGALNTSFLLPSDYFVPSIVMIYAYKSISILIYSEAINDSNRGEYVDTANIC